MAQAAPLDGKALDDAKGFLKKYLNHYNTGDAALAQLYQDDAGINLTVVNQNNQTTRRVLNGKTWVRLLLESWGSDRTAKETFELHRVTIGGNGPVLEVTGQRYSKTRCYWDNNYKMAIAKNGTQNYRITRETALINHNNLCPQPSLEEFLINQNIRVAPK